MTRLVVALVGLVVLFLVSACSSFNLGGPPATIYPDPKETPGNYRLGDTGY